MIKINDKEYSNYNIKITWENFLVSSYNKKRTGIAPFITFNIENRIFIGLEFTFSKEMFENTKLNTRTNITEYLSDILYEDEKGWISIITGKYDCSITRTSENIFKIEFFVEAGDLNIIIDTDIELL